MTGSWLAVALAFALVALNGFFVATEFALVKVRPTRLDELARRGSGAAWRTRRLVDRLDEYLSATQLGITLASLALGWIGEPAFAHLIEPVATRAGLAPATTEGIAAALSFLLITFLHIVFGELAPKSLAIQRSEGTALALSLPMHWFHVLFYPAIWALNAVAAAALRLIGLKPASESETVHTEEELRLIVASMRSGKGGSRRLDVVERTLKLPHRVARDLMVPRQGVAHFRLDQTPEERREIARKAGHSRYPVIESDIDHVAGIFDVRDAFHEGSDPRTPEEMRALLRPPLYVPESMSAEPLFRELRQRHQQLAIVVDEYGGTAGVVTVQDLVDAIVGETEDERGQEGASIQPLGGGRYRIDPRTSVADFAEHFGVHVEAESAASIGGVVIEVLRRIPAVGDKVAIGAVELTVEEMDGPRIASLSAARSGS
ncbi:MAG TPA: hemolysin family protein [Myxococcales bacterium]|nr:hemolysin family protein [Myxococcales bacterium]